MNAFPPDTPNQCPDTQLASNQQFIWRGQQIHPTAPLYEVPYRYSFRGEIDAERFRAAFRELVQRTPTLRIVAADSRWSHPIVRRIRDSECEFYDVSQEDTPERAADAIVAQRLAGQFIQTESLSDAKLIRLSGADWQFYLTVHHALTDALSGRAILRRLARIYEFWPNEAPPDGTGDYGEFIDLDFANRESPTQRKHHEWFERRKDQAEESKFYPGAASPHDVKHHRVVITMNNAENAHLKRLRDHPKFRQITTDLNHFNLLATVLVAWLSRMAPRDSVRIGATVHGRPTARFRDTIGAFVQLLPYQVEVDSKDSFETLYRKVAAESLAFLSHAQPGVVSSELLSSFDVALNVIDLRVDAFCGIPVTMKWLHNGYGDPQRKLTLSAHQPAPDQWELIFDFCASAFEPTERERAVERFRNLFSLALDSTETPLAKLDFLTDADKRFLISHGGTQTDAMKLRLWQRVKEAGIHDGETIAISSKTRDINYAELIRAAESLAEELDARKCGPVVPLVCRRDDNAVVALMGILASDRCFMIIDADHPRQRVEKLLSESTSELFIDTAGGTISVESTGIKAEAAKDIPDDACYILFTSGSTGDPNGVMIGHASVWNLLEEFESKAPLPNKARCGLWTNLGFDVAIYEIFSALLYGRTLVIPEDRVRNSSKLTIDWLCDERIDSAYLPPFFLDQTHQFLAGGGRLPLKRLLVGVESIPQTLLASIATHSSELTIINGYGPTETTVCATLECINPDDEPAGNASIGRPVKGNLIKIVDRNGMVVPPGVSGELWIGGVGVALGYFASPDLETQKFLVDDQAIRWYRSGDRVRQGDDGRLEFLGRSDDQVKIAGVRIEPDEIATSLRSIEGVTDCVVMPIGSKAQSKKLIGFVESDEALNPDELRRELRTRLPASMIPSRLVALKRFPRTVNGKVDRVALRTRLDEPTPPNAPTHVEPDAMPRNPLEYTLAGIASDILGIDVVGIHDDFFDLGGTSLDAINLASRASNMGVDLFVEDIFRHRSIAALSSSRRSREVERLASSKETTTKDVSPARAAIWHHTQTYPNSSAYHFQVRWYCNRRLDVSLAQSCFDALSHRHPTLRTTLHAFEGTLQERIHETLPIPIAHHSEGLSTEKLVAEGQRHFDLACDAPIRVLIAKSDAEGDVLVVTVHHVAFDEASIELLMRQFSELYQEMPMSASGTFNFEKTPPVIVPTPIRTKTDIGWWQDWLRGCDAAVILPEDVTTTGDDPDEGELLEFSLPKSLGNSVCNAASALGVSVQNILLSAYAILLARYANTPNLSIGIPVSQRTEDQSKWIDYCVEALPLACRIDCKKTYTAWIREFQTEFAKFLDRRHSSHQELATELGPLFRVMFVPRTPLRELSLGEDRVLKPVTTDLGAAKFDLTWFVSEESERIEFAIEFRRRSFKTETVRRMADHWQAILSQVCDNPDQILGELDPRTQEDRKAEELLNSESDLDLQDADDQCVSQVISQRCQEKPNSAAVVCGDDSITYRELEIQSREIASELIRRGVQPDTMIGLVMQRSTDLVSGILGILKARCSYVPLDPDLPEPQLRQIAEAIGIRAVVGDDAALRKSFPEVCDPNEILQTRATTLAPPGLNESLYERGDDECGRDECLAYVLHTSGTTGLPKGVGVSRRSLLRSTLARDAFYKSAPERFLMVSPVWFDSSIAGIFWTLYSGGTLVIPTDAEMGNLSGLAKLICDQQVSDTLLLPSLYQLILDHCNDAQLRSLERVIVAGESCTRTLIDLHHDRVPAAKLYNEYGPTEASVWATACELFPNEESVSIGRAAPGSLIRLTGAGFPIVPVGGVGEIHIGGSRLAEGYVADERLTREKYVVEGSNTYYKTGDLARLRQDGSLEFLGRVDRQLKVNGVRVEPAEIESAIRRLPGITDVAVDLVDRTNELDLGSETQIADALSNLPQDDANELLRQAERIGAGGEEYRLENDDVEVSFRFSSDSFIGTPRERQKKWLIQQALRESAADLTALDQVASRFVAGNEHPHLPKDLANAMLADQEIMEDWQSPLMQAMADWATQSHGDVLEIGFGRGVAATMIQESGVRSHTVVEMNPHSIKDYFLPWRERYPGKTIRIVEGRWQDTLEELETYDSVFFHAFPMNESEFIEHVIGEATFAEHFFPHAANLLRPGGVFTYLTTEIDSMSRRHQRSLLQYFSEIQLRILKLDIPPDTKDAWWADSMVVARAIK